MQKYHVVVAFISMICFTYNIFTCPCTASTTDQRPFFEQYESQTDEKSPENSSEKQTTNREEVNS